MTNDVFESVRRMISTREVATVYGFQPNRAGYIHCPFHNEKTPSLKLYSNGTWHCFGCGKGGSSIDFTAELFSLTPLEAVRRLNTDFSLGLELDKPPDKATVAAAQHRQEINDTYRRFGAWRDGFLSMLNEAYRTGYTALQRITSLDQLTDGEALAVRWLESLESWSDCLDSGSMTRQMQIFRERGQIGQLCNQILSNTPPKFGKSWLSMQLCLSVAMGGSFLGYRCYQSGALYLALEDGERRLKSRMGKLLAGKSAPPGFDFTTEAPTLGNGLVDALEAYMKGHPETGLVVVDTLQKIRDMGTGRDVYGKDYTDIGTLKKFADSHNIALLVIHHLRKMGDDSDPFARISGTNGLSGAADTMLVLAKEKRGDDMAILSVTGRDVEMQELVLRFDKSSCLWQSLGDADEFAEQQARMEYMDSPIVRTVKRLLEQSPEGWTGTAQQLLDAGLFIVRAPLADSTRALTNKLRALDKLLLSCDGISHERKGNGSGGGKHKFYFVDAPQFEEMEQSEISPFSEG